MRLNASTYPFLHALETMSFNPDKHFSSKLEEKFTTAFRTLDDKVHFMSVCIGTSRELWKSGQARYIAKTFDASIRKAAQKIIDAGDEYREDRLERCMFLNQNGGTTIYSSSGKNGEDVVKSMDGLKAIFIGFDRDKVVAFATLNSGDYGIAGWGEIEWLEQFVCPDINMNATDKDIVYPSNWKSDEDMALKNGKPVASARMHSLLSHWITYHLITNYFLTHCEVEIKEVKPGEKVKIGNDKHKNESKRKFAVLDCTWFTTLIHTHGHKVNGFFRWQPYGPGKTLRKLIWIDDFERKAYTRKAKVITENNLE